MSSNHSSCFPTCLSVCLPTCLCLSSHLPALPPPLCSRIYEILPQRIQQWQQSPCIAEEQGKKLLERIRRDQQSARMRLTDMEKRFHELEGIIAKAKQQVVQQDEEVRVRGSRHHPRPSLIQILIDEFNPVLVSIVQMSREWNLHIMFRSDPSA